MILPAIFLLAAAPPAPGSSPPRHITTPAAIPPAAPIAGQRPRLRVAIAKAPLSRSLRGVRAAIRAATVTPASAGYVNAIQVYPYSEGLVFQAYTRPGHVTDIALEPGESLISVASGDTVRWVIGDTTSGAGAGRRTHVLVKPFSAGLATNLVITTDRRIYHLALTSTGVAAMAGLSWTYPQDALLALQRTSQATVPVAPAATGLAIETLNFDYAITGDRPAWRPLRAFDDGRQTFIAFPASLVVGEAPPLFLVDRKGSAQLVNYRLRGTYYVVDRLFDAAELRLGTKHQDVVRIERRAGTDEEKSS